MYLFLPNIISFIILVLLNRKYKWVTRRDFASGGADDEWADQVIALVIIVVVAPFILFLMAFKHIFKFLLPKD